MHTVPRSIKVDADIHKYAQWLVEAEKQQVTDDDWLLGTSFWVAIFGYLSMQDDKSTVQPLTCISAKCIVAIRFIPFPSIVCDLVFGSLVLDLSTSMKIRRVKCNAYIPLYTRHTVCTRHTMDRVQRHRQTRQSTLQ